MSRLNLILQYCRRFQVQQSFLRDGMITTQKHIQQMSPVQIYKTQLLHVTAHLETAFETKFIPGPVKSVL